MACGYNFGWRKGELLNLRVNRVDLLARTIRLNKNETKNKSGRLVSMPSEVFTLLAALVTGKKGDDYVFTRVPDLLFHDLRRTAARNLRKISIAESVCMKVTGHKTPSIFKRYDITDEADMVDVAVRLDEKRQLQVEQKSQVPEGFSQTSDRLGDFCPKNDANSTQEAPVANRMTSAAVQPN